MFDVLIGSFVDINTINPLIKNRMKCIIHKGQKCRGGILHFCLITYFVVFFNLYVFCANIKSCVKIQLP